MIDGQFGGFAMGLGAYSSRVHAIALCRHSLDVAFRGDLHPSLMRASVHVDNAQNE